MLDNLFFEYFNGAFSEVLWEPVKEYNGIVKAFLSNRILPAIIMNRNYSS